MKFRGSAFDLDSIDLAILELLQENCKRPLAEIGKKVGLSAPSVVERIHKLEEAGVITGYVALVDGGRVGKDVTAFIGVSADHPRVIDMLERQIAGIDDVLECHHVTGAPSLLVKAKTRGTTALEALIERVRALDGVTRTETLVVLSTAVERPHIVLSEAAGTDSPSARRPAPGRARRGNR